jgi:hypothetical protein
MRSGVLGAILAWSVGAGLAFGQIPPDQRFSAGPPIIPPQLPNYQNYGPPPTDEGGNPMYPPPGNWDAFDLANPAGGTEGSAPRWWLTAEYLMWFPKSVQAPAPLITISAPSNQGIIGSSSTIIFDGNESQNFGMLSGFRVSGGLWFDADARSGLDASGFGLESRSVQKVVQTTDAAAPVIARPFTSDQNQSRGSYLVASPTFGIGYAGDSTSTNAFGFDTHYLMNLYRSNSESGRGYALTALAGLRFFELSDETQLVSYTRLFPGSTIFFNNQQITAPLGLPTSEFLTRNFIFASQTTTTTSNIQLNVLDQFRTRNTFYGGDLGLYQQFNMGRWSLGLATKVALGGLRQTTDIIGYTNLQFNTNSSIQTVINRRGVNVFNQTTQTTSIQNNLVGGGIYAQAGNIGTYERNQFAILPEATFRVAYSFTPSITGFFSYNVIYIDRVVRSPSLITGFVNPTRQPTSSQFGNPSLPRAFDPFPTTDYWLQGVTFGFNVRF